MRVTKPGWVHHDGSILIELSYLLMTSKLLNTGHNFFLFSYDS